MFQIMVTVMANLVTATQKGLTTELLPGIHPHKCTVVPPQAFQRMKPYHLDITPRNLSVQHLFPHLQSHPEMWVKLAQVMLQQVVLCIHS